MDIGIIGAGEIGGSLTRRLSKLGHKVSVANSRGPDSLAELAAETGATAVTVSEAARNGEIVFVAIPCGRSPNCLRISSTGSAPTPSSSMPSTTIPGNVMAGSMTSKRVWLKVAGWQINWDGQAPAGSRHHFAMRSEPCARPFARYNMRRPIPSASASTCPATGRRWRRSSCSSWVRRSARDISRPVRLMSPRAHRVAGPARLRSVPWRSRPLD